MSAAVARALVFFTSAATLVLEILAGRVMAPYVGVTLETFTGIIGVVLAGIAVGAWLGGSVADRRPPEPLLGPFLLAAGALALLSPTLVHAVGPSTTAAGPTEIVILTTVAFFAPAVLLSAIPPMVVKIRLQSLDETGTVVGSLSAIGTAGAIFGTFATGFVLVATLPSDVAILAVGGTVVAVGVVLSYRHLAPGRLGVALLPALAAAALLPAVDGPCDEETTYFCAYVTVDPDRSSGRILWLDTVRHSYVDLEDPTHLGFRYSRVMADVLATLPEGPLDVLFVGGGGFTVPRYVSAVRPGSSHVVLEIDGALVDLARRDLGLGDRDDLRTEIGDARVLVTAEPADAFDVVVGDAFGGLAVPWHLTTREFVEDLRRLLRPDGVYTLNLIDYPPLDFARAEVATIAEVFDHVLVIAPAEYLSGDLGGNFVIAASDTPFDTGAIQDRIAERGGTEVVFDDPDAFAGDARILTDDFAPVDQLISRP
ncbi:MAG: fused MFS/spermidine synthase [Acidimicrobiia bacterium]|nr:fused MFS/spermidine synthase [Acidimicrobiia bacterium]